MCCQEPTPVSQHLTLGLEIETFLCLRDRLLRPTASSLQGTSGASQPSGVVGLQHPVWRVVAPFDFNCHQWGHTSSGAIPTYLACARSVGRTKFITRGRPPRRDGTG